MASSSSSSRAPVAATAAVELGGGLRLSPRLKVLLTFFRSDPSVKPVDEWRLKRALLAFLLDALALAVPDHDLLLRRRPDLHKRKRLDPVASGALLVRRLPALPAASRFEDWRASVLARIDGIELNTEGVGFRMAAELPAADDYDRLRRSWEDFYASRPPGNRGYPGGNAAAARRPDTIVVKGLPSRWFAETRVSSKPSMLVTHTIFSVLGKIRNLDITMDEGAGKAPGDTNGNIISGLHCKIWVQFENYDDFCHALSALCGRSLQKEGSRLNADYEVTCDTEGHFRNIAPMQEKASVVQVPPRHSITETSRLQSRTARFERFDSVDSHRRRFRE